MAEVKFTLPDIHLEDKYEQPPSNTRFAFSVDITLGSSFLKSDIIGMLINNKYLVDADLYKNIQKIKGLKRQIEKSYVTNTALISSRDLPPFRKPVRDTYSRQDSDLIERFKARVTGKDILDYGAYKGYFGSWFVSDGNTQVQEVLYAAEAVIYRNSSATVPVKAAELTAKGINQEVAKYVELYFFYARLAELLNILLVGFSNKTPIGGTIRRLRDPNDPMSRPLKIPQFTKPDLDLDLPKDAVTTILSVVPLTAAQLDLLKMKIDTAGILKASKAVINQ